MPRVARLLTPLFFAALLLILSANTAVVYAETASKTYVFEGVNITRYGSGFIVLSVSALLPNLRIDFNVTNALHVTLLP
jgi:hypothetical protein